MKIAFLYGMLKQLWAFIYPLLVSEVGKFLNDPAVKALALKAVERASLTDLDGDGRHAHAVSELREELRAIGREYASGWLSLMIEIAYRHWKPAK